MSVCLRIMSLSAVFFVINFAYASEGEQASAAEDTQQVDPATDNAQATVSRDAKKNVSPKVIAKPLALEGKVEKGYRTIEWSNLMPPADFEALKKPPKYLSEIEDGSPEDLISSLMQSESSEGGDSQYQQALHSSNIRPEYDQQKIRLPGFVVPLEFDDDSVITSFFLVPYFGACIHQPPPPPNQIIYAEYKKGFTIEALYDPLLIEGTLNTTLIENDMATAAYSIHVDNVSMYEQ